MKEEELRIGNLVYDFGSNAVEIVRLTKGKTPLESPIPLTDEWLLKFGGIPDESNDIYLPLPHGIDMRLYLKYDHLLLCKGQVCPLFEYEHIKNVHQLQNLYFVLTDKELCLK